MKPLVILVASVNSVGHVNACAGATAKLLERGHRIIFLLDEAFQGRYAPLGFEEHVYLKPNSSTGTNKPENPGEMWARIMREFNIIGPESPLEKTANVRQLQKTAAFKEEFMRFNAALKEAIELYRPDAIVLDHFILPPIIPK